MQPAIKWTGSKRSQSNEILKYFPSSIDTYYEPFCGGCNVLYTLLNSNISVNKYICSDINGDLINLWNAIKDTPELVSIHYKNLWDELNIDEDIDRKKKYFNEIRERYNDKHNPLDFMFIMRTTTNGMPRYNKDGNFNNSFHVTRNGINPNKLKHILNDWSYLLNKYNVEFIQRTYEDIQSKDNDILYLDPPYFNTNGIYYGGIDCDKFFNWLRCQKGNYLLSYDGISGDIDSTVDIPHDLYQKHLYIKSGNSSFKRIIGKSKDSIVYESLYIKKYIDNSKDKTELW